MQAETIKQKTLATTGWSIDDILPGPVVVEGIGNLLEDLCLIFVVGQFFLELFQLSLSQCQAHGLAVANLETVA